MHAGDHKITQLLSAYVNTKYNLENLDVGSKIILKYILRIYGRIWGSGMDSTGLAQSPVASGCHKMWVILWSLARLSASQEGLRLMEFIITRSACKLGQRHLEVFGMSTKERDIKQDRTHGSGLTFL
jgi:hypothetical protein